VKSIQILASAELDLVKGYRFYEYQADGVGRYFLDTVYSEIESLGMNAGVHPRFFCEYHRLLSRKFPWAIYYTVEADRVLVHAILDNRSDPLSAQRRFKVQER
tara:strand:- start:126 stop:434 length:309 start_codon:yes stop_codon:yes gene_type:complete